MDRDETIDLRNLDESQTERLESQLVEGGEAASWQEPFRAQGGKHAFR